MSRRGLLHGSAQALNRKLPLATDGDDRLGGAHGECRDQEALDDQVWIALGEGAVPEGRRVSAHEVRDHDLAVTLRGTSRLPLAGSWEAGTPTASKVGSLDLRDHRLG